MDAPPRRVVDPTPAPAVTIDWRARAERESALRAVVDARVRALAAENLALRETIRVLEARRSQGTTDQSALDLWRGRAAAALEGTPAGHTARRAGAEASPRDIALLARLLMDDPALADGIVSLVLRSPPTPGTDALVVDLVSRATDKAQARRRIGMLGVVHMLRGAVLETLFVADRTQVRDALSDWIADRGAHWGSIERERVERARKAVSGGRR